MNEDFYDDILMAYFKKFKEAKNDKERKRTRKDLRRISRAIDSLTNDRDEDDFKIEITYEGFLVMINSILNKRGE